MFTLNIDLFGAVAALTSLVQAQREELGRRGGVDDETAGRILTDARSRLLDSQFGELDEAQRQLVIAAALGHLATDQPKGQAVWPGFSMN
jgi:hypothetical protein